MPFIHIKSLPFDPPLNIKAILPELCRRFAEQTAIPLEHVHATWEYFLAGHFCKGSEVPQYQDGQAHSVLVDLLTPDFNSQETIEKMLLSIAESLSQQEQIRENKIFINHRPAHSGQVYDDGEIVRW